MTPILRPDALRRLAWLKSGAIRCRADFPAEQPFFRAGVDYPVKPQLVRVTWKEPKTTSMGQIERVEFTGIEYAFLLHDEQKIERWFCENRLGRRVSVEPLSAKDYSLQDLVTHFEIPEVPDLAITRKADYEAARERLLCLTTMTR